MDFGMLMVESINSDTGISLPLGNIKNPECRKDSEVPCIKHVLCYFVTVV